jgi:hypothetical protein
MVQNPLPSSSLKTLDYYLLSAVEVDWTEPKGDFSLILVDEPFIADNRWVKD